MYLIIIVVIIINIQLFQPHSFHKLAAVSSASQHLNWGNLGERAVILLLKGETSFSDLLVM